MSIINRSGGVTFPLGFFATGGHCGVKKRRAETGNERADYDLCLIASDRPATAAACFTKNLVCAAPVVWDRRIIENFADVRGVVVNSGCANAVTGEKGLIDCETEARAFAGALSLGGYGNVSPDEIFVCSTGVIGVPLQIDKINEGIKTLAPALGRRHTDGEAAAAAIITTDTAQKTASTTVNIAGVDVKIGGMAKGSGMIHPNMATMLAFITTDAKIGRMALISALTASVNETFNMISVDGDTSTNDTIIALANGAGGGGEILPGTEEFKQFAQALNAVNQALAVAIAKDGEGATKLIECAVTGAATPADARAAAKAVISSSLFKAAMFGADANGGRAICALGYSGASFNPADVSMSISRRGDISYPQLRLFENGEPLEFNEDEAKALLSGDELTVSVSLGAGEEAATAWGCDLSYDYVKINGDYRS